MATHSLTFDAGDVVVVTGGASGIGRAIAHLAGGAGLHVAIWDRDADGAAAVADEVAADGGRASAMACDVGDDDAVATAWEATAALGEVARLVNNAGPPSSAPLAFDEAVALSVGSVRRVTEQWLTGAPSGSSVVNVASIAGTFIATDCDWYTAAKAGIAGYTRYLAVKRADRCRANVVAPGYVDTPRIRASGFADTATGRAMIDRIPLGRVADPVDVAEVVLFLLSDQARYVTGALLPLDGGVTSQQ